MPLNQKSILKLCFENDFNSCEEILKNAASTSVIKYEIPEVAFSDDFFSASGFLALKGFQFLGKIIEVCNQNFLLDGESIDFR